jgi:circadian clock protein KaiB
MARFRFTLYVAGESHRSRQAAVNLRKICEERLGGRCELSIVDVTRDPERAESARILTTPTLVKESPGLPRRVTGDLTNPEQVMIALALDFEQSDGTRT